MESPKGRTSDRSRKLPLLVIVAILVACHSLTPVLSLPKPKPNFDGFGYFGLFRTTPRPGLAYTTRASFGFGTENRDYYPNSDETPVTGIPHQSTTNIPTRNSFSFGHGTENPYSYPNSGRSGVTRAPDQQAILMYHITRLENMIRENSQSIRALQSGWDTIQKSVFSNQSYIHCGGVIPMFNVGDSKLLAYKENKTYGNNERCLWTLDNVSNGTRSKQTLRIVLTKHGFAEAVDWVYALKFNRDTGLVSEKLEHGKVYTFSEDQLYLSFTSDYSVTGTGFVIGLDVLQSSENGQGQGSSYRPSSPGSAHVSPYANNDLINFVINPRANITFEVNSVRTENESSCNYDRLMVWEIGQIGNITPRARLCGEISNTAASFRTDNPVIALFTSDSSNTGPSNAGFRISWS